MIRKNKISFINPVINSNKTLVYLKEVLKNNSPNEAITIKVNQFPKTP